MEKIRNKGLAINKIPSISEVSMQVFISLISEDSEIKRPVLRFSNSVSRDVFLNIKTFAGVKFGYDKTPDLSTQQNV